VAFKITKDDLKKSQKLVPGMHIVTLTQVEEPYFNEKGTAVQKVEFETDKGVVQPYWFHQTDMGLRSLIEFIEAADDIKLDSELPDTDIELRNYIGKKVCIATSMGKDKNGKNQINIDNFYSAKKVPF